MVSFTTANKNFVVKIVADNLLKTRKIKLFHILRPLRVLLKIRILVREKAGDVHWIIEIIKVFFCWSNQYFNRCPVTPPQTPRMS